METFFLLVMVIGVGYLVLSIFTGVADAFDFGVDGLLETLHIDQALGFDIDGFGCLIVAIFMSIFGAVGFVALQSAWNPLLTLLVALAIGMIITRLSGQFLTYVRARQYSDVKSIDALIGHTARITVGASGGKTAEAMVEQGEVSKYPVQEINGAELQRGDQVAIVRAQGHILHVQKIV
ncbi:MAG: YqiJ family protein [Anaerolineae bacterium]|jgi:membrane protein implicated in regulation of membrane protease activity|nr:YqiJ family protein [Anaerolineae bacterium]